MNLDSFLHANARRLAHTQHIPRPSLQPCANNVPRESEPWRRRRVLGDAWDRNLAELLQDGPIDIVCFTGDAANWGRVEEYERAGEFLLSLLERLKLSPEWLFVIPGNHDIERSVHRDIWSRLRQAASQVCSG